MVRSSVVSAVSSACEIRLLPCIRCFCSTNSKRSSSRKAPGSLATPCVDQLVLSTQKAEPHDACAAPAAANSATPPEHAIANRLFIPFPPEILSGVPVRSEPEHAQQACGFSRTLESRWDQEKKGGARGGAQGSSAAGSCGSEKSSRTGPVAGSGQRRAGAEPEIAGPRSALKGHRAQCEGRAPLLKGLSPECFWPAARQTSEGSAGALVLAFASSGQDAFSAMPASASQAAMRLRKRCAFTAAFLAQMRALFQP